MPAARTLASAIFDSEDRKMVVFGGEGAAGRLNDIWEFDLDAHAWADLTPAMGSAPSARITPVSVYDTAGHQMITWSGQGNSGFFNDVWSFDLTTDAWTQYAPVGGPPNIRYGAAGVFDPVTGDLVTFAGFTNLGRFDDVWRFNDGAVMWSDVTPLTGPVKRCLHSASYDSQEHRMIMYAGQSSGALDDIWAFDLSLDTWTELTPASGPVGRWFAAHVYDSTNHRATIFAGNADGIKKDDVWVFDLTANEWHPLTPSGVPPAVRDGAVAVYDGANDRMVVFGGRGGPFFNDVWSLDDLSDTPTGVGGRLPAQRAALHQNYPNPFNPQTTIAYSTPKPGTARVRIYDVTGRLVRTLVDEAKPAGYHVTTWDGRDDYGTEVGSGVYFVRLEAGGHVQGRKMVFVK
jgi:hypothetical protein